jgi:hypothetical protein
MNERIKKLYIKTADGKDWAIGGLHNAERFAELIIRESIEVMVKNDYHGEWLGKKVKEHFGVKDE